MAKKKKPVIWGNPVDGMVQVNSKAYGQHQRRKRGTVKPATVNESFKAASKQLLSGNEPARLVKDALNPYRKAIYDGTLWSRMLSLFYSHAKQAGYFDFRSLEGLEMHQEHPLGNVMNFALATTTDALRSTLRVSLSRILFRFPSSIHGIESALLTPVALFVDESGKSVDVLAIDPLRLKLTDKECAFVIPVPENAGTVLLCLLCEGMLDGRPSNNARVRGMKIVSAVALWDIAAVSSPGDDAVPAQQLSLW